MTPKSFTNAPIFYNAQADGAVRWDSCGLRPNATSPVLSAMTVMPVLADFGVFVRHIKGKQ
jgi:hypothetical protein